MNWLQLSDVDRDAAVNVATRQLGFNANVIEKDWWVVMALRALFDSSIKDFASFKGGTSLSKGWGLIERFSEDADIALDKSFWGLSGDTRTQRDRIRKLARSYIREKLTPELEGMLRDMGATDFEMRFVEADDSDKDPTVVLVPYRSLYAANPYVPSQVKIEISSRSLKEPRERIRIRPYLAEVLPDDFGDSETEVTAVVPSRTFLEKIFLLHEELCKDHPRSRRITRHLYDIEHLMDTDFGREALADTQLWVDIVKHRAVFNNIRGIDYRTLHPGTIDFIPKGEIRTRWAEDYARMRENFIYGDALSFDELIARLEVLQQRIRKIEIDDPFFA